MNHLLSVARVTAAAGAFVAAFASTSLSAPAPTAVSVTATGSVVSTYMFRGLRINSTGFQPSVEATAGNLALGVWGNFPLRDKVPDGSDPEFDLYGSYTIPVNDALSIVPGFTTYHYPKAPTNAGFYRSTYEPNLALTYTIQGVRWTPKVYYDLTLDGPTYELTAFYAYPLKTIGSELDFTATFGTYKWKDYSKDASPAVKAWGDYWLVGVAAPFQISANAKITIGFAYTEGREAFVKAGNFPKAENGAAVGRGVTSISYAWAF